MGMSDEEGEYKDPQFVESQQQSSDEEGEDPPQTPEETRLVQKTYDKHHLSVVRITRRDGGNRVPALGTGFVVHNDETSSCLILTCHHVIREIGSQPQANPQLGVIFEGVEHEFLAEELESFEASDLALLRVRGAFPDRPALEFSDETDLSGLYAVLLGYFGIDGTSALATPSSTHGMIMSEPVDASEFLQHIICDYVAEYGTSGGPVILDADKVVGVNYQMNLAMSCAVTAATVKSVLKLWLGRGDNDPDMTIKEMLQLRANQA